jgi:hypothetical protein
MNIITNRARRRAGLGAGAVAATSLLMLGLGAGVAQADPPEDPVTAGHVDIVEFECAYDAEEDAFDYEFGSHVITDHVDPTDIGDYTFSFDTAQTTYVQWKPSPPAAASHYLVPDLSAGQSVVPYIGFNFELESCEDEDYPYQAIRVDLQQAGTSTGEVIFDTSAGSTSSTTLGDWVEVTPGQHLHGDWEFYTSSAAGGTYDLQFFVQVKIGGVWTNLGTIHPDVFTVS